MVTGEYHNKNWMALYTVHVCLHVLHTHVNHILLHDGNKNTNRKSEARQHLEWPHVFFTGPAQGQLLSHYLWPMHTWKQV